MVSLRLELIVVEGSLIQNLGICDTDSFICFLPFLDVLACLIALRKSYLRKAHFFRN